MFSSWFNVLINRHACLLSDLGGDHDLSVTNESLNLVFPSRSFRYVLISSLYVSHVLRYSSSQHSIMTPSSPHSFPSLLLLCRSHVCRIVLYLSNTFVLEVRKNISNFTLTFLHSSTPTIQEKILECSYTMMVGENHRSEY